jgi:hypothetical protein
VVGVCRPPNKAANAQRMAGAIRGGGGRGQAAGGRDGRRDFSMPVHHSQLHDRPLGFVHGLWLSIFIQTTGFFTR